MWSLNHWAIREVLPGPLPKTAEADASVKARMIPLCLVTVPKKHPGMTERVKKQQKRELHLEGKLSENNNWCQGSDIGRKQ